MALLLMAIIAAICQEPEGPPVSSRAVAQPVFPNAMRFRVQTAAGRGGRIIKVTNLNRNGRGSFAEAVAAAGPRIVVFEVGGVIDLDKQVVQIGEPMLTIAGQTAPSPGITFIRGGIAITTHDVLIQHIRVRTGDANLPRKSGWEPDGIALVGGDAHDVVIDHCSLAWAIDENLSASGPRFDGEGVDQWRRHTSHNVIFRHSIIAEGLSRATHHKGEHSKGSLIHDNVTGIAIIGNLYASNVQRNPLFKGGVRGVVMGNLIYNPGSRAVHYRLPASEWGEHPYVTGQMALVGNFLQYGPDTQVGVPLLSYDGDGPLDLYARDNLAFGPAGEPMELIAVGEGGKKESLRHLPGPPLWLEGLRPPAAAQVPDAVLKHAGARPWDRDEVDQRIVRQVREKTGRIIDSQEQVGGYPAPQMTRRKLSPPQENVEQWLQSFTIIQESADER